MRFILDRDMETHPGAREAAAIVRSCVHCGFCNATCPTYQLSGNELEGPRGRIYLMKSWLEAGAVSATTQAHLDQCLLCRNCETTCPSGVQYGRLLDIVRPQINAVVGWSWRQRLLRGLIRALIPYPRRWRWAARLGRLLGPLLPQQWSTTLALGRDSTMPVTRAHRRRVLLLGGCAQPVLNPNIDFAARAVFDRLGMALVDCPGADCCGALPYHLGDPAAAVRMAKANIDAWWPQVLAGAEAIIATSSGCGVHLRDYAQLLVGEPDYASRAETMTQLVRDPIELIDAEALRAHVRGDGSRIAVQTPCTLQHGLQLAGRMEALLRALGWDVVPVADGHLCCGSAGAHSLLHRATARELRTEKLHALSRAEPTQIVTANIGCQLHLAAAAKVPVKHWLELVASALN